MKINKRILFIIYLLMVTAVSLLPSNDIPEVQVFPYFDKVVHFGMYALFSFLLLWAWPQEFSGKKQLIPFLMVVAYGFLMEVLQRFTHLGRTFDLSDELANCLGFFPGWLFGRWSRDKENLNGLYFHIPFINKEVKE